MRFGVRKSALGTESGHNLIGTAGAWSNNNQTGDELVAALSLVNIGETYPVYLPAADSPAIDRGNTWAASALDQNGLQRIAELNTTFLGDSIPYMHSVGSTGKVDFIDAYDLVNDGDVDILSRSQELSYRIQFYEND